jgi:YggT family protein
MTVLARLLLAVAHLLDSVLWIYQWVVIIAVLVSWVNPNPNNPIVQFLNRVTQPLFSWVRRTVPGMTRLMFSTGLDLSPLVVLAIVYILRAVVPPTVADLARSMAGQGAL